MGLSVCSVSWSSIDEFVRVWLGIDCFTMVEEVLLSLPFYGTLVFLSFCRVFGLILIIGFSKRLRSRVMWFNASFVWALVTRSFCNIISTRQNLY